MLIFFIRIIATIFLVWFVIPIFKGYFNHGNKLGILMCIYALFYTTKWHSALHNFCAEHQALSVIWQIVSVLIYLFIAYAVIISIAMLVASLIKPKQNATAITLGIRVTKDGPSPLLKGRINATKDYLDNNPDTLSILSGAKCKKDYMVEAQCMYDELIALEISPDRLIIEDKSQSTYENILFSNRIIEEYKKEKNLAIITDPFHQLRARLIIRKLKIKSHIGAVNSRTPLLYIPTYCIREWIALVYEVLFRFRPHR